MKITDISIIFLCVYYIASVEVKSKTVNNKGNMLIGVTINSGKYPKNMETVYRTTLIK